MSNNLTVAAKSAAWFTTQKTTYTGRPTAPRGFFMSACLYLPVMTGGSWFRLRLERLSVYVPFCGEAKISSVTLLNSPLQSGGSKLTTRRLTMAQLRLLVDDRLSVYAKRVRNAIKYHLPVFGDSPRILLDEQEISRLAKISIEKVRHAIKELMREGYLAPFYHGRKSKCSVYALQNPSLSGDAMEVWA